MATIRFLCKDKSYLSASSSLGFRKMGGAGLTCVLKKVSDEAG